MTMALTPGSDAVARVLAEARAKVADLDELPSVRELRQLLGRRKEHVNAAHRLLRLERAALLDPSTADEEDPADADVQAEFEPDWSRTHPGPGPVPPVVEPDPVPTTTPETAATAPAPEPPAPGPDPVQDTAPDPVPPQAAPLKPFPRWPLVILALGAFVAVWSGWVGLGRLTGFGLVNLLPGIVTDGGWSTIDTAITLPLGVEAYAAIALGAVLSGGRVPTRARRFAGWSAAGSLIVGTAGQAAYHLLVSHPAWLIPGPAGSLSAPWWITTTVSALPVAVLGMGAALAHLMRAH